MRETQDSVYLFLLDANYQVGCIAVQSIFSQDFVCADLSEQTELELSLEI